VEFLGFLGWEDGRLADLNVLEVETRIAEVFRRVKPDVIITFHGSGISYHPDHRVISLAVSGAFRGAGRPEWYGEASVEQLGAHSPSKLYHYTVRRSLIERVAWPRAVYASSDDEITTVIDTSGLSERRWRAIQAHETQKNGPPFELLREAGAFAEECFVRVSPTPCPGNPIETDLLEGLDER
jgi:LmbE family N-acetylglucosaminyl deacetylase